jgi:UDP-2-acetamido-2,6-beta-L-arabino-hexul-4-ose reductase
MHIGITGQNGFLGYHMVQGLKLYPQEFDVVHFDRAWFDDEKALDTFVSQCDVIIHLAALNRHHDQETIYAVNTALPKKLVSALERTQSTPHILISSSIQEDRNNLYGDSKRDARLILAHWAEKHGAIFTGLIMPNIFGPFGHPRYNSVIATFCHQVSRNETPFIEVDTMLHLIYVGDVVRIVIENIRHKTNLKEVRIEATYKIMVSDVLKRIQSFKEVYQDRGEIPDIANPFELQLFNTYRCYMDIPAYFPRTFVQHTDPRGAFVEIARHGISGQTSFSTTVPGITRGNHFHTRKIERFAVIKGKALIQLRRIGTDEVHNFYLDGSTPAYVDMPIWYTHNIKNIGDDTLYTIFWINEPYDERDPDTYFENVTSNW